MTRRSLLPRTCTDYPARRPQAAQPPSPATPDTPLLLRPLRSLGEIPGRGEEPLVGSLSGAPALAERQLRSHWQRGLGRPQHRAPPPAPPPGRNNLFRPRARRSGRVPSGSSRGRGVTSCPHGFVSLEGHRFPWEVPAGPPPLPGAPREETAVPAAGEDRGRPFPAGLCFVISSPLTRARGRVSHQWGQAAPLRR